VGGSCSLLGGRWGQYHPTVHLQGMSIYWIHPTENPHHILPPPGVRTAALCDCSIGHHPIPVAQISFSHWLEVLERHISYLHIPHNITKKVMEGEGNTHKNKTRNNKKNMQI